MGKTSLAVMVVNKYYEKLRSAAWQESLWETLKIMIAAIYEYPPVIFYLFPLVNTEVKSGFLVSIISLRADILSVWVTTVSVGESLVHNKYLLNLSVCSSSSQQRPVLSTVSSIFKRANWCSAWAPLLSDYNAPPPPLPSMSALVWALGRLTSTDR